MADPQRAARGAAHGFVVLPCDAVDLGAVAACARDLGGRGMAVVLVGRGDAVGALSGRLADEGLRVAVCEGSLDDPRTRADVAEMVDELAGGTASR